MVPALLFLILIAILAFGGWRVAGRLALMLIGLAGAAGFALWLFAPAT